MPLRHYYSENLFRLPAKYSPERGTLSVSYETEYGDPGSLENCEFGQLNLQLPDNAAVDDFFDIPLQKTTKLRFSITKIKETCFFGWAAYLRLMDGDEIDPLNEYNCPVCAHTGPFQSFPPTEFDMDCSGSMTVPAGMAMDPSFDMDVKIICKECGFEGTKQDFYIPDFLWISEQPELPRAG